MAIDLQKLAQPQTAVVPIRANSFRLNRKLYRVQHPDGWWRVEIHHNTVTVLEPHCWAGESEPTQYVGLALVTGFTHNNTIVFEHLDATYRRFGFDATRALRFNQAETFQPVRAVVWDGAVYYTEPHYRNVVVYDVQARFDGEQDLEGLKGVTPELRSLYVFHSLERVAQRDLLARAQREADERERTTQLPYRMARIFERAGAELLSLSQTGDRIVVDWRLRDGQYRYNSVIDSTTGMVREAGFCMSGADSRMNPTAMIKTAEDYEERDVVVILRHT